MWAQVFVDFHSVQLDVLVVGDSGEHNSVHCAGGRCRRYALPVEQK
jgi:hypothetical protein